jgi:hypothetical protein
VDRGAQRGGERVERPCAWHCDVAEQRHDAGRWQARHSRRRCLDGRGCWRLGRAVLLHHSRRTLGRCSLLPCLCSRRLACLARPSGSWGCSCALGPPARLLGLLCEALGLLGRLALACHDVAWWPRCGGGCVGHGGGVWKVRRSESEGRGGRSKDEGSRRLSRGLDSSFLRHVRHAPRPPLVLLSARRAEQTRSRCSRASYPAARLVLLPPSTTPSSSPSTAWLLSPSAREP